MARTYKRDKNGKFASTGGGGAASARATNRVARTQSTERGLTRVQGKGRNKTYVTTQRPNSDSSARVMTGTAKAKTTKGGMSYSGQITPYKRGGKVEGGLAGAGSGASSRGKSLRQTVAAKRGVESTKQAAVRSTKYGGPKPFADQQTASRSINRSMSKAANTRIASTSAPMSKSASKALGAKWQSDAATLKANKARRLGKKK